jgi:hypothetical protein
MASEGKVRDEVHRLLRSAMSRIQEHRHADECTFWNAYAALELTLELLDGATAITGRETTAVDELTAYLRASLRTALDEIASQGREEDALDSGRLKRKT